MLNLTSLLCSLDQPADALRYGRGHGSPRSAAERRPVVVWNVTRRCNLRCVHCYSDSAAQFYDGELTDAECRTVCDDLAGFGVPAVLLSGGEPLMRPRFFELASYARSLGLRLTLSTNGTLLTPPAAEQIKDLGFSYVGISLDGIGAAHDSFRGRDGAFLKAMAAFRNCREVGQKVGLRLTLTRHTVRELDNILRFIEDEDVPRVCFYHLVYSGRGSELETLQPAETKAALDKIMDRVEQWTAEGRPREVLTVDQPADAAYLLMRLDERDQARAGRARELLSWNGGGANSSGIGIGNIDSQGNVHPDQFWQSETLGNVKEQPFSQIWTGTTSPVVAGLRQKPRPVEGRCADCRWFSLCGGGFRVRAWQRTGNPWAEDPGCYLSQEDILLS
jgi:radical SAM protein with 4Fe4S-binding SPASM domain